MPLNLEEMSTCAGRTFLTLLVLCSLPAAAQDSTLYIVDTVISGITLQDVRVTAFENNRTLKDVPAAVGYVGRANLLRTGTASIVGAVNMTPGVRMEERSPGSFRFNIRGSSLRAPFGVRNVKVYFNDLPFTDPGGTTYLNGLGYYNFNSIEIIKGPGSSLYGAGTGGVLLIQDLSASEKSGARLDYSGGSYGLHHLYASVTTGNEKAISRVGFQRQQSDGYRNQSALKRDVYNWTGLFSLGEQRLLRASFLYSNLAYGTPGALTLAEYKAQPKAARPGGGGFPGAEAARAFIYQKTFLAGISYEQPLLSWLRNKSVLYGMFTELNNPNLRGYEKNALPHVGGRTSFLAEKNFGVNKLQLDAGGEWQEGFGSVGIYKNVDGRPDSLRTSDEINNRLSLLFLQASLDIADSWTFLAGASMNWSRLRFTRFTPASLGQQSRRFQNGIAPRLSLMKRFQFISIYTGVSKGFSPPSTAELLPTGGAINLGLDAERGVNYDIGIKGRLSNELTFDLNAFVFQLDHTIVQRRNAGGGDAFINAGKTAQRGLELMMTAPLFIRTCSRLSGLGWFSYTYHHFRYKEFKQLLDDFSGRQLPGVAPHTLAAGYDLTIRTNFTASVNYFFSDRIALNDGNTAYANAYHLLGAKLTYGLPFKGSFRWRLQGGADNVLNQRYSLGNDINGFGGRYYNAAPLRNFFGGISMQWINPKKPLP